MRDHNANFHTEGPNRVNVWRVVSGPRAGALISSEGPMTLSDLDRQMPDEHGEHWRRAILNHSLEGPQGTKFWVRMDDLSLPADHMQPILRIRFRTVKPGQMANAVDWLEQLSAVAADWEELPFGLQVFRNRFAQGLTGPSFANVNSFDDWATLDNLNTMMGESFPDAFDHVHGAGSHEKWSQASLDIFADSYDEVWERVPWLSSPPMEARR